MSGDPYFDDVLLHVKMNGTQNGTVFTDLSKYARPITAHGTAKTITDNAYVNGSSGYFDGSSGYLTVENITNFTAPGNFVIQYFARLAAVNGYRPIIEARAIAAYQMFITGIWDGKLDFFYTGGQLTDSPATISAGTWVHCAIQRVGTTLMYYTAGQKSGTTRTLAGTVTPGGSAMMLGKNIDGSMFSGLLADLKITARSLFGDSFTPPNSGLPSGPVLFAGSGIAKFTDGTVADTIKVWDADSGELVHEAAPTAGTGEFSLSLPTQSVQIAIFKGGYRPLMHGPITLEEQ